MDTQLVWIISGIGALALAGVFWRIKPGFGPFNLKVVGIVLVATLVSILALSEGKAVSSAMGILGAIAGYLFGVKSKQDE